MDNYLILLLIVAILLTLYYYQDKIFGNKKYNNKKIKSKNLKNKKTKKHITISSDNITTASSFSPIEKESIDNLSFSDNNSFKSLSRQSELSNGSIAFSDNENSAISIMN